MNPLLTPKEAALRVGFSVEVLLGLARERRVPHLRFGPRLIRFDVAGLDAWRGEVADG